MKSSCCTRRLRTGGSNSSSNNNNNNNSNKNGSSSNDSSNGSAAPEEDEPNVLLESSAVSIHTTCERHCSSSCGITFQKVNTCSSSSPITLGSSQLTYVSSSSSSSSSSIFRSSGCSPLCSSFPTSQWKDTFLTKCEICERLQGSCYPSDERKSSPSGLSSGYATTQDQFAERRTDNDRAKMCDANPSARIHADRVDRTLMAASRVQPGPPTRCASSVVRWDDSWRTIPRGPSLRLVWTLVFLLALSVPAFAEVPLKSVPSSSGGKVCQSIDIRNDVSQFTRLKGCRVVEGFVQITLIDHADASAYANLTFPDLVEITDYLVLYRVNGLRSVGHLFPNLTVIRGHSLFINYALVAFEMMHLQEIGLHSLTDILRGSVRFEKNPVLCYVDTIDWDVIAKAGKGEHVISGNKPKNGCPICDKHCPQRLTKPDENLCWNREHCQRICADTCKSGTCNKNGDCCNAFCLGGCSGSNNEDCAVCREVIIDGHRCMNSCPPGSYKFMNRRCISEEDCRRMKKPREAFSIVKNYPYKPFNGSCVIECPAGYMDDESGGKSSCAKCDGPCLKVCTGALVDSIASAQKLRGCTHIDGSLEIQIRGGKNIVKELEDNLNMIEEIDGYLKIVRSFPLVSLNFFKSLRVIHGKTLDSGKYTLAVLDNQNLQELWDWSMNRTIRILSRDGPGRIFFHFNPKLCLYKIETLREKAGLPEFTDLEVAPNSNGDKVACNVTEIAVHVTKRSPEAALIEWEAFKHHDPRSLLGYVVYCIEAPYKNITMYDGRDACGGDGWRVDDVSAQESPNVSAMDPNQPEQPELLTHILTNLKPYTQYAFYVKTYTIATERSGAQSKVYYFTTLPDAPSTPRALTTWSNEKNELVMSWFPPLQKNGNLTHYRIVGRWEPDDPSFLAQRNYCEEPMLLPEKKPISVMAEEERKKAEKEKDAVTSPKASQCECKDRKDSFEKEKEAASSIAFEDALHNQVYIRRQHARRRRRDIDEFGSSGTRNIRDASSQTKGTPGNDTSADKIENGTYIAFERLIPSTNLSFVMKNLRHFAAYNIEVQACREQVVNDSQSNCSTKSMRTYRTLPLENADNIPPNSFKLNKIGGNNSLTMVKLRWEEPPQPNGLIVTYQIEYKRVDIQNVKATVVCIIRQNFTEAGNMYLLRDLPPGNYSVRVRATSLAGNGNFTEVQYFYIEEYSTVGTVWIVLSSAICLILLCSLFGTLFMCRRKNRRNVPSLRLIATVNPEYVSAAYVPDEWEVPRKKVELLRELGNGSFGMVYEGVARDIVKGDPEVRCAVKTVNDNATDRERIEFLNEASVMKAFNTHHVVRLLGVVSQGQPTLVVMELMANGDLKTYLRRHRPDECETLPKQQPPTLKRILQMAIEIADGMAYLAAKKFVHRDLAARNCMVAEDLTVKIGDFGMTRDVYETEYYRKGTKGLLPVRWMAPESLKDGVFTSFSDVWSYGVVLWEMVTLASQPYQGLANDQVLRYVIEGGVMERPENCPDSLYDLMRRTWNHKANRRPTFIDIITMLLTEIDVDLFEKVSFYHSPDGIEARNQNISHSPQTDKDLETATLQDLREKEAEEDSPLRQDFGDFASFDPMSIKNSLSPRYNLDSYGENSKATPTFRNMNSSKIPLKAGFDDFDGVSAESVMVSSKDTLNLPFAEDSLKSAKSRSNVSQASARKSGSPQSTSKPSFSDSPSLSRARSVPDYENRSPESLSAVTERKEVVPLRVNFSSMDAVDGGGDDERRTKSNDERRTRSNNTRRTRNNDDKSTAEYVNKPESLNNGYIGGATT